MTTTMAHSSRFFRSDSNIVEDTSNTSSRGIHTFQDWKAFTKQIKQIDLRLPVSTVAMLLILTSITGYTLINN